MSLSSFPSTLSSYEISIEATTRPNPKARFEFSRLEAVHRKAFINRNLTFNVATQKAKKRRTTSYPPPIFPKKKRLIKSISHHSNPNRRCSSSQSPPFSHSSPHFPRQSPPPYPPKISVRHYPILNLGSIIHCATLRKRVSMHLDTSRLINGNFSATQTTRAHCRGEGSFARNFQ